MVTVGKVLSILLPTAYPQNLGDKKSRRSKYIMNEATPKKSMLTVIISLLLFAVVATFFLFWRDMSYLNNAYADMNRIEFISSSTQRQISLAETNGHLQKDIFFIDEATQKTLSYEGETALSVMDDPAMVLLANEVLDSWLTIERILSVNWNLEDGQETQDLNLIDMRLARDSHFKAMTDLSTAIGDYTVSLNSKISQYQMIILALLFVTAMVLINHILQTQAELLISKELAEKAQIDIATGLYNRSRCQELFKGNQAISDKKTPAVMVLDLNELKSTNDTLGHRVGDELIGTFAGLLKSATAVHTVAPFIGRYGGDEFIVFYDDVAKEEELKVYLDELAFLTKEINDNESRFQVSYAVGYAIVDSHSDEKLTTRQLFDKADAAMYENKIAGKRAKNQKFEQQEEKTEV